MLSAPTRVKICGITRLEDARAAVLLGADAVGFVFAESPRKIQPSDARKISIKLGPFVARVGVFVDTPAERVLEIMKEARLSVAQLHGSESPADCKLIGENYRVIKVFKVGHSDQPSAIHDKLNAYTADAYMLETDAKVAGGSGLTWDWSRFSHAKFMENVIVTGGLNPQNVRQAIRTLNPYGVDVSSGVEERPGIKDFKLMETFIQNAKKA